MALFVALAVGACGEDRAGQPMPPGAASGGEDASFYREAKGASGAAPSLEEAARDLGVSADDGPVPVAEEYASIYQDDVRQAVFEGCLQGFDSRGPQD